MIKKYLKIIFLVWLIAMVMLPQLVLAENSALKKLQEIGTTPGPYAAADADSVPKIVGVVISASLALLGVVFLALMLYAGYHWMTARGEEEKVEKAKDTITRAIIGLIIVVGAYVIWEFILFNFVFK